jgi:hypothetical protein
MTDVPLILKPACARALRTIRAGASGERAHEGRDSYPYMMTQDSGQWCHQGQPDASSPVGESLGLLEGKAVVGVAALLRVVLARKPIVHSCDLVHQRLQLALVVPVRQRLDLVNNACRCTELVAFLVRRNVPKLMHDVQVMRDALLACCEVWEQVVHLSEACPHNGGDAHAAWLVRREEHRVCSRLPARRWWRLCRPLLEHIHLAVKERALRLVVRVGDYCFECRWGPQHRRAKHLRSVPASSLSVRTRQASPRHHK